MIESVAEYSKFLSEISEYGKPIIVMVIPTDEYVHPVVAEISAVFIRDTHTRKTYHISLHHQDSPIVVSEDTLVKDINKLPNQKFTFDKKSTIQMIPLQGLYDLNLLFHLKIGKTVQKETSETQSHRMIYRSNRGLRNLNNAVPLLKHKEMFDNMCDAFSIDFNQKLEDGYQKENDVIIDTLSTIEQNGIHVNQECFNRHFDAQVFQNSLVYSQYNIYTSTGRPSNHFSGVNYAALNKDNGVRKCFVSRFGQDGKMVLVDYSAFHPRIICHLIDFPLSIDVDIYKYLGDLYFKGNSEYDINEAKKLTFRQLYGGVEEQFEHIKYFARLKEFITDNWKKFQKNGFILTPMFKRTITKEHIVDPNPSKLFNYILQATETEIAIPAVKIVNDYLSAKQTKVVLYTYDSVLIDFHKEDGKKTLEDILTIMKMGNRFPVKAYAGSSYDSVIQIYP